MIARFPLLWLLASTACRPIPSQDLDAGSQEDVLVDSPIADLQPDRQVNLAGQPCPTGAFDEWHCGTLEALSPDFEASFQVAVRWNLPKQAPAATAIWIVGPVGKGSYRTNRNGTASIQDQLATNDEIRSVEIDFSDPTGLQRRPGKGFTAAGKVLAAVIGDLHASDVAEGEWTSLVTDGNLTTIAAAGLSHARLDNQIQRFVLLGGPYLTTLGQECADEAFFAALGSQTEMRTLVDVWNGWEKEKYCQQKLPTAQPSYEERSVLGAGAHTEFPNISVNVLVGDRDTRGPWLQRSNRHWYESIIVGSKTFHLLKDATDTSIGSLDTVGNLVQAYVRTIPLTEIYAKPTIVFSDTPDGLPITSIVLTDNVYIRVSNSGGDALMCTEADNKGDCATLSKWAPPNGWRFSLKDRRWDFDGTPESLGASPGSFSIWWRNQDSEQHSDVSTVNIL